MPEKPIDWPTDEYDWWWMRYRISSRSKWRTMLVEAVVADGTKWVRTYDGDDVFTCRTCQDWDAMFAPAQPPPEDWR